MIHFAGDSFAALTLKEGARRRGLKITDNEQKADLIFVSQDTPTKKDGTRQLKLIETMIRSYRKLNKPMVVTSQTPPGWIRQFESSMLYCQAETLRIEDGLQRAMYPEMFIVGHSGLEGSSVNDYYRQYLQIFQCPVLHMTYEECEFAKVAINMTLAAQVDNTNRLAKAAQNIGADWGTIAAVLRNDSRIGKYSYLTPGDWKKSPHLLRDWVTFKSL